MKQRHYIEDLQNFDGTLQELKLVVDYLYENYGYNTCVNLEIVSDTEVGVLIDMGELH
jgi:hypothetical protein